MKKLLLIVTILTTFSPIFSQSNFFVHESGDLSAGSITYTDVVRLNLVSGDWRNCQITNFRIRKIPGDYISIVIQ
jgi:hypothetical protein